MVQNLTIQLDSARIADSVVANIAVIAAKEADGVADTVTTTANELMTKVGMKSTAKGVRVVVSENAENTNASPKVTKKAVTGHLSFFCIFLTAFCFSNVLSKK